MFGIGDKILAYIGGVVSVLLALALAGTIAFYTGEVRTLKDAAKEANARADTASKNSGVYQGGLEACNAGVKALTDEKAKTDAKVASALATIAPIVDKLHKSAIDIMKATPGADKCKSADDLIMEHVQ
jgi:hypothetical protein